jgi:hypothetical protein
LFSPLSLAVQNLAFPQPLLYLVFAVLGFPRGYSRTRENLGFVRYVSPQINRLAHIPDGTKFALLMIGNRRAVHGKTSPETCGSKRIYVGQRLA